MFYLSDLTRRLLFVIAAICAFVWVILVVVTKAGAQTVPASMTSTRVASNAPGATARVARVELALDAFTTGPRSVGGSSTSMPMRAPQSVMIGPGNRFRAPQNCMVPDVNGQCASGGVPSNGVNSIALYAVSPGGKEPLAAIRDRGVNRYVTIGDHVSSGVVTEITDDGLVLSSGEHVGFVRATLTAPVPQTVQQTPGGQIQAPSGVLQPAQIPGGVLPAAPLAPNPVRTIDPAYLQNLQSRYPGVALPTSVPVQSATIQWGHATAAAAHGLPPSRAEQWILFATLWTAVT